MDSFIISLISGHLFSKGADAGQGRFQRYIQKKGLSIILDEYDDAFMHHYNTEISLNNCDMSAVFEKRAFLISCAKDYFTKDNSDITKNVKQEFIDAACKEIDDASEVIRTYLDYFYLLVFTKETKEISIGFKALLNAYADSQYEINAETNRQIKNHSEEIGKLKKEMRIIRDEKAAPVDFRPYYQLVEERFVEEKEEESIVGSESDEKAYIDAYIKTEDKSVLVLSFLEGWFVKKEFGVMLIHGEPGHGKTMLCRKAVVEFCRGKYLKGKAENVITVSLNTGENRSIIDGGKVTLSNSLAWGAEKEHKFSFEDCRGSLLFLDGFDEFIDDAKQADARVDNICTFMKRVKDISKNYDIHIVVLSRTIAVTDSLKDLSRICSHFELLPVSDMQQDEWLERHPEYSDYRRTFQYIRQNSDLNLLLGVPLLFRLIVYNRFDTISSNVVELYNNLFVHLMNKRNIYKDIRLIEKELMNLSYEVYCTDSNMAVLDNWGGNPHWLFTFYVKTSNDGKIGFYHRSFYQYYFAKYIYMGIINLKDKEEGCFIGLFAERILDDTILKYLSLLIKEEDKSIIYTNLERMIIALAGSEAYLNLEPRVDSGDAAKSRISRSTNIYRNILKIAAAFSYVIQLPFEEKLDRLMRSYNSYNIVLVSKKDRRANLKGAFLAGAFLSRSHLNGADLSRAYLRGANLSDTFLKRADLSDAILARTDLSRAYLCEACLSRAHLSRAHLIEADLSEANLSGAYLIGADAREASLIDANLTEADLTEAHLYKADLDGANLTGANLTEAYLNEAELFEANLSGANLSDANLTGADLTEANLSSANLTRADLREADLTQANLSGAELNGADLNEAILYKTIIDVKYKDIIDFSAEGYSSIKWVSNEGNEHS